MEPYVALDDLETYMQVEPDSLPESAELVLDAAMETVRGYLDQEITFHEDDVETHHGAGSPRLRLRQRPVRDVTSITVDDEEMDSSDYSIEGAFVVLPVPEFWIVGSVIKITYDHGWDAENYYSYFDPTAGTLPVPADIKLATLSLAQRRLRASTSSGDGSITSETIGAYTYMRDAAALAAANDLQDAERSVLDRYAVRLYV